MRRLLRLAAALCVTAGSLTACSTGVASLDEDKDLDDGGDGGSDDGGDDGSNDGDDDAPDVEPDESDGGPAAWSGDWSGTVALESSSGGGGWGDVSCEGGLFVEIDDDGGVWGEGDCDMGWGSSFGLEFDGDVSADGDLGGTLWLVTDWSDPAELTVWGAPGDDDFLGADIEGEMAIGGWGEDEYTIELVGWVDLERE